MNSTWNNNIENFRNRFPQLAEILSDRIETFEKNAGTEKQEKLHDFWQISQAKNGAFVAQEGSLRLHSAYNPQRESESAVKAMEDKLKNAKSAVFLGFGLGYTPIAVAMQYPTLPLILIEPDIAHFFAAMLYMDFQPLFKNPNIIFAVSCTPDQSSTLINQYGVENSVFFSVNAHQEHAKQYFDVINALIERNRQKEKINQATLSKFGKLWESNCRKNKDSFEKMPGVKQLEDTMKGKPFLLLAAGPSLDKVLPHLSELSKKMVTVCVDTALRACLRANVEPDFIVLTDPQYWAYRHIAGLKSPSSILITELAVYPAVYGFECKKIFVCNSQVPMAKNFTDMADKKGDLGAGGSVASCAWNLCRLLGGREIYAAGLDLSFPGKQTHIKGSTFEEAVHRSSTKISTAITISMPLLFGGNACIEKDYKGNPVITDQRMKMFAWWFESRLSECPDTKTYTICPEGLAVPGIIPVELSSIL